MLKHLLVFLGMLGSLVWAGHRLYYGPTHYTRLSQVLAGTGEHRDPFDRLLVAHSPSAVLRAPESMDFLKPWLILYCTTS